MLGIRLRQARRAQGLSRADVVERMSSLGQPISGSLLASFEADRRLPDSTVLITLGEVLQLRVNDLNLLPEGLLALPAPERERLLELAAVAAEQEYRTNCDLTDFEAFGDDDLHDATS